MERFTNCGTLRAGTDLWEAVKRLAAYEDILATSMTLTISGNSKRLTMRAVRGAAIQTSEMGYVCSTRFPKPAQAHYASAINVLQDMDKGCVFGDTQEEAAAALRRKQDEKGGSSE